MVGHYWLRAPDLAPDPALASENRGTIERIQKFASEVHRAVVAPERGGRFSRALVLGIGGSALGLQLAAAALRGPRDPVKLFFVDNTDPDGIDRTLADIGDKLGETLVLVTSKSGGTKETRNGMLEAEAAWTKAGLDFTKHVIAVTGAGSELDKGAVSKGWLRRFPLWDWVGGRFNFIELTKRYFLLYL